jgi:hypothetical protein
MRWLKTVPLDHTIREYGLLGRSTISEGPQTHLEQITASSLPSDNVYHYSDTSC